MIKMYSLSYLFGEIPSLDGKLLDVGGADPYFSIAFLEDLDRRGYNPENYKRNITIFDRINEEVARKYDKTGFFDKNQVEYVQGNVQDLPFQNGEFDIVALGRVLQDPFVSSPEKAIKEVARVLKLGGYLIGDVPLHDTRDKFKVWVNPKSILKKRNEYQNLIEKNGFLVEGNIGCERPARYHLTLKERVLRIFGICHKNFYFVARKIK